jgi:hypothetical protein
VDEEPGSTPWKTFKDGGGFFIVAWPRRLKLSPTDLDGGEPHFVRRGDIIEINADNGTAEYRLEEIDPRRPAGERTGVIVAVRNPLVPIDKPQDLILRG